MIYGSWLWTVAGLFGVSASVTLYRAVDALRVRSWRDAALALAVALPSVAAGASILWYGDRHPPTSMRANVGFPSDWSCFNPGRGAGTICGRDADKR